MIQATDLRIGNLIQLIYESNRPALEERIVRVDRIDEIGVEILENGERVFGASYELLEGIPLTEEILLKCGFVSNSYQDRYENEVIHIECNKTRGYTELWIERMPHIRYLHQLQNLYWCLCGKELEVNL